jgi:hypothetical protein
MDPNDNATHAALIVQSGCALNSLNSSMRLLAAFKTPDKKLQSAWTELRKLSERVYTRLAARLVDGTADYMNEVSNQSEQLTRCLCYLPADQRRKLVAQAEDMARPFAALEQA